CSDRGRADVPLACRRPRRRGPRHARATPPQQPSGVAADAQASQKARVCTEIAGDRQAALLRFGVPALATDVPARTRASEEQSGGELASACKATRTQDAALQIGSIRPTLSQHARRSTTPSAYGAISS